MSWINKLLERENKSGSDSSSSSSNTLVIDDDAESTEEVQEDGDGDLFMLNIFNEITQAEALLMRNEDISNRYPDPGARWNFDNPDLPDDNQFPLEPVCFSQVKMVKIKAIASDTLIATWCERHFGNELEFDYGKLQKAIDLDFGRRSWKYLWNSLGQSPAMEEENQSKRDLCKSIRNEIKREFHNLYGPVDPDDQEMQIYFRRFFTSLQARVEDLKEMLAFYQNIVATDGELVARSLLIGKLQIQKKMEDDLVETVEKAEIYDINPFTNRMHLDWFLLKRHPQLSQDNLFIHHTSLERLGLVDYRFGNPTIMKISGYWPSLFDLSVLKTVPISKNLLLDEIETKEFYNESDCDGDADEKEVEINKREGNMLNWNALLTRMMTGIAENPLGMRLEKFMIKVKGKRYLKDLSVCPKFTETEIVEKLPDVFLIRQSENPWHPNRQNIILFPAYLNGIVPDNLEEGLLYKVWKRTIFLAENANRKKKINLESIEKTYKKYFNVEIAFRYWGFANAEFFCRWSKQRWDERDGEKVRIMDSLHKAGVKYLEVIREDD